jgi:hypothetical protein
MRATQLLQALTILGYQEAAVLAAPSLVQPRSAQQVVLQESDPRISTQQPDEQILEVPHGSSKRKLHGKFLHITGTFVVWKPKNDEKLKTK